MRIVIADDHSLFRDGLGHMLSNLAEKVEVVEAGSLESLVEALERGPAFDLVIADLSMPGMAGPGSLSQVKAVAGDAPIVVISASEERADVREALEAGVAGYIPKSARGQVMLSALQLVLVGGVYVPPLILDGDGDPASHASDTVTAAKLRALLTERQVDVLRLLAEGKPNKEIARELNLAEGTVRVHVNAVLKALSARNRTEAALAARNAGLF